MIIKLQLLNLELIKRKKYKYFEKKKKIISCLKKNQNQIKKVKVYLWQKKIERSYKLKISKQINRCCLTGRAKFFIKNFGLSRHAVNLHAFEGLLQNTKVRSW
jgi:ribosomal protein S14